MSQVESYAEIFRRQVYGIIDRDPKVVEEAVDITMNSAAQLKDVGLDLTFVLRNLTKVEGAVRTVPPGELLSEVEAKQRIC